MSTEIPIHLLQDVKPPATTSIPVTNISNENKEKLIKAITATKLLKQRLCELNQYLRVEVNLLDTLIYKNHNKFRNDKGFKDVKLVKKSWTKVQSLQMEVVVTTFHQSFPLMVDLTSQKSETVYLPTRQMLQFVLVRLRGCFHLLHKLQILCENAADRALKRLRLGHFWSTALAHMALVSRLWTLGQVMLVDFHQLYKLFHSLLPCLPSSEAEWIPLNYIFPSDLFGELSQNESELLKKRLDSRLGHCHFPEFVTKNLKENENFLNKVLPRNNFSNSLEDHFGEVIQREDVEVSAKDDSATVNPSKVVNPSKGVNPSKVVNPSKIVNTSKVVSPSKGVDPSNLPCTIKFYQRLSAETKKLTSTQKLAAFLDEETKFRKSNRKNALTKKLDQSQWRELRSDLKRRMIDLPNDKISVKQVRKHLTLWILYPDLKGEKPKKWKVILEYLKAAVMVT